MTRTPLVISSHGETFLDADQVYDRSRLLRGALRRALRSATVVTACSGRTLYDLDERFGLAPGSGSVVPKGIELDEPAGPRPDFLPERYVLAVGRMVRDALRAQAADLGLHGRAVFLGFLNRGQVVAAMSGALVVVVPWIPATRCPRFRNRRARR